MTDPAHQEIIIVRRQEQDEEQAKGGVWKIAHADFMTAMMAFFLVMWLISQTDQNTRASVANYFNPVQLAQSTPNKKGLEESTDMPPDGMPDAEKAGKEKGSGEGTGGKSHQLQKPRFKEGALFQDPYAVLARIAADIEPRPQDTLGADATPGESEVPGLTSGEAYRDPFDPLYWKVSPVKELKTELPRKPGTAPAPTRNSVDEPAPASPGEASAVAENDANALPEQAPISDAQGKPEEAGAPASEADREIAELKSVITAAVQPGRDSSANPIIEVRRTGAGTLISLTDDFDFSMFAIGSAEPHAKVVRAMEKIAAILKSRPGKIVVRGHTDGRPFKSEDYDNWRLSQARAQMALYMLVRGGLPEERIVRVEGHADRDPKNAADRNADENRRIEILLQE
ncbi:MotB family protein [Microvirga roseola]|uniref:MotB family protein n=1 Tax=Microvirga roseola TaxID=2883126 RepID=UPI001E39BB51|nr:MotB family protein [Microvirga roseola]